MKVQRMSINEFMEHAVAYLEEQGHPNVREYNRCNILVQCVMYDDRFQDAFDQFEWSDENFEALYYFGQEVNEADGVPFVVGNCGGDSECCLTFVIYHDGNNFCVYFGEDADVDWRSWEDEDVQELWTDDYVAKFIEWIKNN